MTGTKYLMKDTHDITEISAKSQQNYSMQRILPVLWEMFLGVKVKNKPENKTRFTESTPTRLNSELRS